MARKDYHDPHYVCPKRADRKAVTAYVEPSLHEAARALAERRRTTVQEVVERALSRYIAASAPKPK
jgi:predicted HicB family RNase H-like nuclease